MIGISFLVKDDTELGYLRRLLQGLTWRAEDVFITITNNAPKIEALCKKKGVHYNFFPWVNDFSKARQFGYDNLPKKYDYVFTCDADDIIEGIDNLDKIVSNMKKMKADTCYITYVTGRSKQNGDTIVNVPRIVKRDSGKWVRPIHEVWVTDSPTFIIDGGKNIKCIHTKTDVEAGEKRNLDMLLSIKKKTDEDRRYIASSYITLNDLDNALKYLEEIKEDFGFYYDVLVTLVNIYAHKKQFDKAEAKLDDLVRLFGEYSDPFFEKGKYLIDRKRHQEALDTYLEGFKRPKMRGIITSSSHNTFVNPLGKMAYLYEILGQHDKALWCVEVLKKIAPELNKVKEQERLIK